MALPVNIDDLVNFKTVESSRIEFKKGWNDQAALRTICAFANDINEVGGGYLIFGIDEVDGTPSLPPEGIRQGQLDRIQKECLRLCKQKISPNIFPEVEVLEFQGKYVIVIWVLPGEERPYSAPATPGPKSPRHIYVRFGSNSVQAGPQEEAKLRELASKTYFDDRRNTEAKLEDLDLALIQSYLQEIGSQLYAEVPKMSLEDLARKMQIARGPEESLKPLNAGLLFFSKRPDKFFPGCKTNLVEFHDDAGTSYSEKTFTGPIHVQIRQILEYLNTNVIKRYTYKAGSVLESENFFNYPFAALEEAIVNSLYHRSFENETPNEIRVYHVSKDESGGENRRIEILSYPGPMPPIDENALSQLNVTARNYRNIRLGDWLKSISLAEKYATGIPTIVQALKKNGSGRPILSTDDDKTYFMVHLPIHPDTPVADSSKVEEKERVSLTNVQQSILEQVLTPKLLEEIEYSDSEGLDKELEYFRSKTLVGVKNLGGQLLYFITEDGREALKSSF